MACLCIVLHHLSLGRRVG